MIEFYSPEIEETGMLPAAESQHAVRVLRLRQGDELSVVDGKGARFRCRLSDANPHGSLLEIVEKQAVANPWPVSITLAVAPTKNADRMEWLAEKAVEIGIDELALIGCKRSERKVMKRDRLERVMVAAMKQSLKARLPLLTDLTSFNDFISRPPQGQRFIAYCSDEVERREFAKECKPGVDTTILIGPEGDFSPEEAHAAIAAGFVPVTFGECRLRTETAALFGLQTVHIINSLQR